MHLIFCNLNENFKDIFTLRHQKFRLIRGIDILLFIISHHFIDELSKAMTVPLFFTAMFLYLIMSGIFFKRREVLFKSNLPASKYDCVRLRPREDESHDLKKQKLQNRRR